MDYDFFCRWPGLKSKLERLYLVVSHEWRGCDEATVEGVVWVKGDIRTFRFYDCDVNLNVGVFFLSQEVELSSLL